MELVCTRRCLDKDNKPYEIGNRYKYYDSQYVFDTMDNKVYDIYQEQDGQDIYMGNGSYQFIKENFFIKGEITMTKLICKDTCSGPNGFKYLKNKHYYYSLKEMRYEEGEPRQYIMYNDEKVWLGYVKLRFINRNFIKWDNYVNDFLQVDELFETFMYG